MTQEDLSLCRTSLYLRGDDLLPDQISSLVGLEPTEAHRKGKTWTTSSNKQVVEKTGAWSWTRSIETEDVAGVFSEFLAALPSGVQFRALPGVREAYLDVFVANGADEHGGGESQLILDPQCLNRLASIGLPLQLTFDVVPD